MPMPQENTDALSRDYKRLEFFELMKNSDTVEGRGPDETSGFAVEGDRKLASAISMSKEFGRRFGVMGTPYTYDTSKHRILYVIHDVRQIDMLRDKRINEEIKLRALAKLDPIERAALGFT